MSDHQDYLAARERLRRVEAGEDREVVYRSHGIYDAFGLGIGSDKATIYDAEHDTRPATVEWIQSVCGGEWHHVNCLKCEHFEVWDHSDEGQIFIDVGINGITNPTRVDVLRLLGVFQERRV